MRWSHLFSSTIRNRGFLYYKNGHVEKSPQSRQHLYWNRNRFQFSYLPGHGHGKNDVVRSMSCTCPYAQGRIGCKHEAAVLYMIEQEPELDPGLWSCKTRKAGSAFKSPYFRSAYGISRKIHLLSPGRNGKVPSHHHFHVGKRHWILCVKASLN